MKKIIKKIKIKNIKGGLANPAPPIGPILGSSGINIIDFCKKYNEKTKNYTGKICPVIIYLYEDKSFDFIIKTEPISYQLLKILKLDKGSKEPNKIKIGKISYEQIKEIAKKKMHDLNCFNLKSAISMIYGTAKSMGIEIFK
ncbi:50S ribosomal protein L11 [Candidatus Shikimatogenerans silvanidophilus]|uniref:50S ribosomal protein L11 n=1 Tax=Candidatus Shikimatogenerans silvanidophilus TaxID=2782547 RepID=UPI001BA9EB77|nr:50S ribosomal protein L11 [Candidatus Shikimatogenerans silvanidophilus]